jgi:hypothetical protein
MTGDFERGEWEMARRNVDRPLDNDETISEGMRDGSEKEESNR